MFHLSYNLYRYCKLRSQEELNFAIVGLPNGGKSTAKKVLDGDANPVTVPTIGATKPIVFRDGKSVITIFDLGGSTQKLWLRYYHKVHGIIWVVDAAEPRSLQESKLALNEALQDERLRGKPIIVFANKQDLPGALSEVDIATGLGLDSLTESSHSVLKCALRYPENGGVIDPNLAQGLIWLRQKAALDKQLKVRVACDTEAYEARRAAENADTEKKVAKAKEARRLAKEKADADAAAGVNGSSGERPRRRPRRLLCPGALLCTSSGSAFYQ